MHKQDKLILKESQAFNKTPVSIGMATPEPTDLAFFFADRPSTGFEAFIFGPGSKNGTWPGGKARAKIRPTRSRKTSIVDPRGSPWITVYLDVMTV